MKVDSVYHSVYPSFFCCTLFGISTVCPTQKNGKWFLSQSIIFKLSHFFWIYLMTILSVISLLQYEDKNNYYEGLAGFVIIITKWSLILQIFLNFFSTIGTSSKMKSILEDISFVDNMMQKSDVKLEHLKHFLGEIFGILIGCFYVLIVIYFCITTGNNEKISSLVTTQFILFYATFVLFVFGYRFCMLMTLLLRRYWILNRELNLLNIFTIRKNPKLIASKIENFLEIYFYLNNAGDKIKDINQIRFLALYAGLFLINICTLFTTYYEYYIKENIYSAFSWFAWTVLVWMGFVHSCFTCHFTVNEARKTGVILHKFLLEDINSAVSDKMLLFSNRVLNADLEYYICGFFPVDGSLFYMLVGATFNYMIIMLQFEEGSNDTC